MAEFLTTEWITHHRDKIIEEAKRELVLISPYIKSADATKELLRNTKRAISIDVLYGKKELTTTEKEFFERHSIKTTFIKNLHAKCYLNEDHALLTSMNLHEFSQKHNAEMGILVSRENDGELYEKIRDQAMRWKTASSAVHVAENGKAYSVAKKAPTKPRPTLEKPKDGFCIGCRAVLPANPKQPYCKSCYASWDRNKAHKEDYCHTCGKKHVTTLRKPLCPDCYKKYADFFTFVTS